MRLESKGLPQPSTWTTCAIQKRTMQQPKPFLIATRSGALLPLPLNVFSSTISSSSTSHHQILWNVCTHTYFTTYSWTLASILLGNTGCNFQTHIQTLALRLKLTCISRTLMRFSHPRKCKKFNSKRENFVNLVFNEWRVSQAIGGGCKNPTTKMLLFCLNALSGLMSPRRGHTTVVAWVRRPDMQHLLVWEEGGSWIRQLAMSRGAKPVSKLCMHCMHCMYCEPVQGCATLAELHR